MFGESEISKANVLLSGNTIQQDLFKEDKIISSPQSTTRDCLKQGHFNRLYLRPFSINLYIKHK